MADNYLERQYAEYERRKAGKNIKPADRKRFYTRVVTTKTHEQRQQEIQRLAGQGAPDTSALAVKDVDNAAPGEGGGAINNG